MDMTVHSRTHVEIRHGLQRVHLERDDAEDLLESIDADPKNADGYIEAAYDELERMAVSDATTRLVTRWMQGDDLTVSPAEDALSDHGLVPTPDLMSRVLSHVRVVADVAVALRGVDASEVERDDGQSALRLVGGTDLDNSPSVND